MKNVFKILMCFISILFLASSCQTSDTSDLEQALVEDNCAIALDNLNDQESSATHYFYKGLCERRIKNYPAAIQSFQKALENNFMPKIPIYLHLASSHAALDQPKEAYHHLDLLISTGYKNDQMLLQKEFDSIRQDSHFQAIALQVKPSYSLWMSLFLFVSLQALFMSMLLFFQKSQPQSKLLAILIFSFSIILFSFTLYWSGYNVQFPYINNFYHLLPYGAGPLFYLYIRANCTDKITFKNDYLHFLPVTIIAFLISPWIINAYTGLSLQYIPSHMSNWAINPYTKILSLCIYFFISFQMIRTTDLLNHNYKSWLNYLLIGFAGYTISMLCYYILIRFSFFSPTWDYTISFALSFFIFLVSFMGYLQPRIVAGESVKSIIQPTKYAKSSLPNSAEQAIMEALHVAMQRDELYKKGDLRLEDLALAVNSNRHDVSMVINKNFQTNFFDFLNRHRIDYIAQEISSQENSDKTLIQLAYQGGFNNKVSFNKAFKKYKGMTPSQYRKQFF